MVTFYDPITERWHTMPEKKLSFPEREQEENSVTKLERIVRELRIWGAVVSTATATQTATQCPDGSGSAASES